MYLKNLILIILLTPTLYLAQNPKLKWAKSYISSGQDEGLAITHDAKGNTYTTGYFRNTIDLDPGPGTYSLTTPFGLIRFFITKLDSSGQFVWAKSVESASNTAGNSIRLDASGNIYIAGHYYNICDFDPGPGSYTLAPDGNMSSFILKLDSSGNFIWAKSFGGRVRSLSIDDSKNVFTTGGFSGTVDFDPGINTNFLSASQGAFISKLDSNGSFVWAKSITGYGCEGKSLINDAAGCVYTSGYFGGTYVDFDPGLGTYSLSAGTNSSITTFVSKLDASGNFVWAKKLESSILNPDNVGFSYNSIALDSQENVYTTGYYQGSGDLDPGPGTSTLTGSGLFLSKLDASGNFIWAKGIKGAIYGRCITLDINDNIYVAGGFGPTFYPMPFGIFNLTGNTYNESLFISKFDSFGNLHWAGSIVGGSTTRALSISVDVSGNLYLTGGASGGPIDFDPDIGTYTLNVSGGDIFILKMSPCCSTIGMKENSINDRLSVFPNPTSGSFKLNVETMIENGEIELINSYGEIVFFQKIVSGENEVFTKNISSGLYYYIVFENGKIINKGKIIFE